MGGRTGGGGVDSLYYHSSVPLTSIPAMEGMLAVIRTHHTGCRHVAILHIWPLTHGAVVQPHNGPRPLADTPPTVLN